MAKPGFFAWYEWRHGIGRYKGHKPRDPWHRPKGLPQRIPLSWWVKNLKLWHGSPDPAPVPPKPVKLYMYDDVNVSLIPRNAQAAAGYVDGHWLTYLKLKLRCPRAKLVSIAVFAKDDADVLDVEPGDATNAQAVTWVRRQRFRRKNGAKAGTSLPALYTAAANGEKLIAVCTKAGLAYGKDYLWWSAHYDPKLGEHLCHPGCYPGIRHTAHATQFTDHANNLSLDESICSSGFLA